MMKEEKLKKNLIKAGGQIPTKDKRKFVIFVNAAIKHWGLTKPVDIMVVNRMVSTWMKMRHIEESLSKYGMFLEERDKDGKLIRVKVNEIAYYLKQMDSEFRAYYRLLSQKKAAEPDQEIGFLEMLEEA